MRSSGTLKDEFDNSAQINAEQAAYHFICGIVTDYRENDPVLFWCASEINEYFHIKLQRPQFLKSWKYLVGLLWIRLIRLLNSSLCI